MQTKNTLKVYTIISIIAFVVIFMSSCNNSKKYENKKHIIIGDEKSVKFYFDFPDTIHVNKSYDGKIVYKSEFDTIIKSFDNDLNSIKSRYIIFNYAKTNNINYDEKYLKSIIKDSIAAHDCHNIYFYNIIFKELGSHYIDGIISDFVSFDINEKDKNRHFLQRQITKESRATKNVYVIP